MYRYILCRMHILICVLTMVVMFAFVCGSHFSIMLEGIELVCGRCIVQIPREGGMHCHCVTAELIV